MSVLCKEKVREGLKRSKARLFGGSIKEVVTLLGIKGGKVFASQ